MLRPLTAEAISEAKLVQAAANGDRDSFASLYETHAPHVYRYLCTCLGSVVDAEDVTAEVFIKAMRALPSYKPRSSPFAAWLFRIARNEMVNHAKKHQRRREVPLAGHEMSSEDPAEMAVSAASSSEVRQAMAHLTDLQREVLALRFASELSIAETAAAMKRSPEAVKFLQHSALRALRRVMGPKEDTNE